MCKTIMKLNRAAHVTVLANQTPNPNSIHIKRTTQVNRNPTCLLILWVISHKCPLWVVDTLNDSSTWSGSSDFAIPTCVLCIPFVCDKLFWLSKYFFWVRSLTISKPYGCLTSGVILPGGACHPLNYGWELVLMLDVLRMGACTDAMSFTYVFEFSQGVGFWSTPRVICLCVFGVVSLQK